MTSGFRAALLILVAFLVPAQVLAVADHGSSIYEVRRPMPIQEQPYEPARDLDLALSNAAWNEFIAHEGADWLVTMWSEATDRPLFAVGPGLPILGSSDPTPHMVESAARQFIADHPDLFGVDPQELEVIGLNIDGAKQHIVLRQQYQGLEVIQADVHLNFMDGRLVAFGSGAYDGIELVTAPGISVDQAVAGGRSGLPWNAATDGLQESRLVVLPMELGNEPEFFLAYELMLETEEPLGLWRTYVDASDGELLARTNEISFGTFSGNVAGDIQLTHPEDPYTELPLADDQVVVSGGSTVYTNEDGDFSASGPDNQTTVTARMFGRYVRVYDDLEGSYDEISVNANPGDPIQFEFDDTNTNAAERDGFYHTNVVHEWIKNLDPSFTSMDTPLLCRVNLSGSCNAYWNGNSINFYREGGGCLNIAQMPSVVYHEYHHGVTQFTYAPNGSPTPSGMNEGFSDYCGMTIMNSPWVGHGWTGGDSYLRTGENLRQYPGTECGGQVHCLGEILMGSLWKMRVALVDRYGEEAGAALSDQLFRDAVEAKTYNMPAFLNQILLADDDNANVGDGTPNYYEICDAFAEHNLDCPDLTIYVEVVHTPHEDTPSTTAPYEIVAELNSVGAGAIDPDSVEVYYSTDGESYSTVAMSPTGNPDEWLGEIPAQASGTLIDYYIRAVTVNGIAGTHPHRAPEQGVNQFLVGMLAEKLGGGLEDNTGWVESADDDDATDGFWEWGDPEYKEYDGEPFQPEFDHSDNGVNCYVTRNLGGYWTNGNVDNGKVTLTTPGLDFTTAEGAGYIEFWFFMVDYLTPNDVLRVDISSDGTNWHSLAEIDNPDVFAHNEWTYAKFYFRESVVGFSDDMRIRFVAEDKPNNSIHEVAIDDVVVKVNDTTSAGVGDGGQPRVFRVEPARPNPFGPTTNIRYQLPKTTPVKVEVYNVAGERVRTLTNKVQQPGVYDIAFDGRSGNGHQLPAGIYYARIIAGSNARSFTLTLLR
ncbi:MAG: T9SS type A sorting domain-containing protein [Candidatus Eisenbacteria bacterium]|nr:T9SS type A sorting domain-containing protein [Candidatus Eisenbacteria bacterium]